MPRRLLALPLAALALLAGAGCADDVSPALRVGDTSISTDDFLDEVDEWAGNSQLLDPQMLVDATPGTYPADLVREILQQRLDFELARLEFEARGLELDDVRDQAIAAAFGDETTAAGLVEDFSEAFAQQFLDDVTRLVALQLELGDQGYGEWQAEAYESFDIEVNPRFGSWDEEANTIVAPEGPTQPAEPTQPGG